MLTFFRRIRKRLLSDGAASKYLLYAIGEIALVVIGILIALQINNWNEWRKDREKEKAHLEEIAATANTNIVALERIIQSINRHAPSGVLVHTYLKTRDSSIEISPEDWHWALMGRGDLTLSTSGYESLKSQGFDLLTNSKLKTQVVNLFEKEYPELKRKQNWGNTMRPEYDKFIVEHFINNTDENGQSTFGKIPRNKNFLLDNHYYYGLIELAIGQSGFYSRNYQKTLDVTQKVLQRLCLQSKIFRV
jgi:hypothetical protein